MISRRNCVSVVLHCCTRKVTVADLTPLCWSDPVSSRSKRKGSYKNIGSVRLGGCWRLWSNAFIFINSNIYRVQGSSRYPFFLNSCGVFPFSLCAQKSNVDTKQLWRRCINASIMELYMCCIYKYTCIYDELLLLYYMIYLNFPYPIIVCQAVCGLIHRHCIDDHVWFDLLEGQRSGWASGTGGRGCNCETEKRKSRGLSKGWLD